MQDTPGAIGYVEKGFAQQVGAAVRPDRQRRRRGRADRRVGQTAVDAAKFTAEGKDLALDLNALYATKEPGAYPLMLATYEIVCSKGYDADTSAAVKSFLTVSANQGQAGLSAAGYVPLPDAFKERLVKSVDAIG